MTLKQLLVCYLFNHIYAICFLYTLTQTQTQTHIYAHQNEEKLHSTKRILPFPQNNINTRRQQRQTTVIFIYLTTVCCFTRTCPVYFYAV